MIPNAGAQIRVTFSPGPSFLCFPRRQELVLARPHPPSNLPSFLSYGLCPEQRARPGDARSLSLKFSPVLQRWPKTWMRGCENAVSIGYYSKTAKSRLS